jgi:cellulose synthase/poly-beta-1,6-N-acetylglucosamine synthase-like glycosyltransferase
MVEGGVSAITRVAVIVPARDEAALIERCLAAVHRTLVHVSGMQLAAWIVVVADRCRDRTAAIARRALGRWRTHAGTVLEIDVGSVGHARAAGVAAVLAGWGRDLQSMWLANTDADTTVSSTWMAQQLVAAESGFAAVAGVVDVKSFPGQAALVRARFHETYEIPAQGPHLHVHGCNIGVRADAYVDVGGWPALSLSEDHALWKALRARGWPCLSDPWLRVTTSGRRDARAAGGFADTLAALGEAS